MPTCGKSRGDDSDLTVSEVEKFFGRMAADIFWISVKRLENAHAVDFAFDDDNGWLRQVSGVENFGSATCVHFYMFIAGLAVPTKLAGKVMF